MSGLEYQSLRLYVIQCIDHWVSSGYHQHVVIIIIVASLFDKHDMLIMRRHWYCYGGIGTDTGRSVGVVSV